MPSCYQKSYQRHPFPFHLSEYQRATARKGKSNKTKLNMPLDTTPAYKVMTSKRVWNQWQVPKGYLDHFATVPPVQSMRLRRGEEGDQGDRCEKAVVITAGEGIRIRDQRERVCRLRRYLVPCRTEGDFTCLLDHGEAEELLSNEVECGRCKCRGGKVRAGRLSTRGRAHPVCPAHKTREGGLRRESGYLVGRTRRRLGR